MTKSLIKSSLFCIKPYFWCSMSFFIVLSFFCFGLRRASNNILISFEKWKTCTWLSVFFFVIFSISFECGQHSTKTISHLLYYPLFAIGYGAFRIIFVSFFFFFSLCICLMSFWKYHKVTWCYLSWQTMLHSKNNCFNLIGSKQIHL